MYYIALATDYDGTLAQNGRVEAGTIEKLKAFKASGRRLILVTGRVLPELVALFPEVGLFDLVVAENGALLYDPRAQEEVLLAEPPPAPFVEELRRREVAPLSVGRAIVATWEPNETKVLATIRDLGLELHIIFNKGAVMVLPSDINKASGLKLALKRLGLSAHNVIGIGDAENDQAFLAMCGLSAAVANAVPSVQDAADLAVADHGRGIVALVDLVLETELRDVSVYRSAGALQVGIGADQQPRHITPLETILVAGSSGGGKSTIVTALLEQMMERGFQFCVVDPEGDYGDLDGVITVGGPEQEPRTEEAMELLAKPDVSVIVNLIAIDAAERPAFLAKFLPEVVKLRASAGRPHWLVLDEAHHCLPKNLHTAGITLPREMPGVIAVTVHPEAMAQEFLKVVTTVIGVGEGASDAVAGLCERTGRDAPDAVDNNVERGEILLLDREGRLAALAPEKPRRKQRRHVRKYAEGDLGEDKSFYFRGPDGRLNLRAQNLSIFLQISAGVDEETWLHHLRGRDYSRWVREAIKDEELATEIAEVERRHDDAAKSRDAIKSAIDRKYTLPASG